MRQLFSWTVLCAWVLTVASAVGFAQQKTPVQSLQEDCGVTFSFTAASSGAQAAGTVTAGSTGTTPVIDNRQVGCIDWLVTYEPSSAVATVSLAFQTALDVAGVPTTWSNYPGTLVNGINPNTAVTTGGAVTEATGTAYPFLRMNLTVLTGAGGRVSGKLYGWKRRPTYVSVTSGGGCVGTLGTPCQVQEVGNGTVLSGQQSVTGSAVALATHTTRAACVKALISNMINVFVGPSGITTSTGYPLAPGESLCFPVTNTNLLFVIASTTGASVGWAATN